MFFVILFPPHEHGKKDDLKEQEIEWFDEEKYEPESDL